MLGSVLLALVTISIANGVEMIKADGQYHNYSPDAIAVIQGTGDKGVRVTFADGNMEDLGQITWRNPKMPDLGLYNQFATSSGKNKWVKFSDQDDAPFGSMSVSFQHGASSMIILFRAGDEVVQQELTYKGTMSNMHTANYIKIEKFAGVYCEVETIDETCVTPTTSPQPTTKPTTESTTSFVTSTETTVTSTEPTADNIEARFSTEQQTGDSSSPTEQQTPKPVLTSKPTERGSNSPSTEKQTSRSTESEGGSSSSTEQQTSKPTESEGGSSSPTEQQTPKPAEEGSYSPTEQQTYRPESESTSWTKYKDDSSSTYVPENSSKTENEDYSSPTEQQTSKPTESEEGSSSPTEQQTSRSTEEDSFSSSYSGDGGTYETVTSGPATTYTPPKLDSSSTYVPDSTSRTAERESSSTYGQYTPEKSSKTGTEEYSSPTYVPKSTSGQYTPESTSGQYTPESTSGQYTPEKSSKTGNEDYSSPTYVPKSTSVTENRRGSSSTYVPEDSSKTGNEDYSSPTEQQTSRPTEGGSSSPTEQQTPRTTESESTSYKEDSSSTYVPEDSSRTGNEDYSSPTEQQTSKPTEGGSSSSTKQQNHKKLVFTTSWTRDEQSSSSNYVTDDSSNSGTAEDYSSPTYVPDASSTYVPRTRSEGQDSSSSSYRQQDSSSGSSGSDSSTAYRGTDSSTRYRTEDGSTTSGYYQTSTPIQRETETTIVGGYESSTPSRSYSSSGEYVSESVSEYVNPGSEECQGECRIREDCRAGGRGLFYNPVDGVGMCTDSEVIRFMVADGRFLTKAPNFELGELMRTTALQAEKIVNLENMLDVLTDKNERLSEEVSMMMSTVGEMTENFRVFSEEVRADMARVTATINGGFILGESRDCEGLEFGGACYEMTDDELNFNEATSACREGGGNLASWTNDQNAIHTMLLQKASEMGHIGNVWIGANFNKQSEQTEWLDGTAFDIKITRSNSVTSCGATFKKLIAGFKCSNNYRAWCKYSTGNM